MVLYLREFETFPVQTCLYAQPGEIAVEYDSVNGVNEIAVDLHIHRSGDEYYCQGTLQANLQLECVRCLKKFDIELAGEMDFIICSVEAHNRYLEEAVDDEDYVFFQGNELKADITDIVRQSVMLAVPMMPICSPGCKGLCSQCGADLNEGSCGCQVEKIDERWAGLRDLLRNNNLENRG